MNRLGYRFAKRTFDLAAAVSGLLLTSPLLVGLAIWIKAGSEGPVFYRGERVGRNGLVFRIFKFRSMVVDAEKRGGSSTADDDPRITRAGAFMRRYKLDELPQLLNVLAGDMSIVGPRPQVAWDVARYTAEERALLSVRPGMTDWASMRFHNEGEILKGHPDPDQAYDLLIRPEKMRLALLYVQKASFATDLLIIFETLTTLVRSRTD